METSIHCFAVAHMKIKTQNRTAFLLMAVFCFVSASPLAAQDADKKQAKGPSELELAEEVSRQTGRPMFVVAGSKT